ncbi:YXWGXW repeat-containing protein [Ramlibacter sp.]|uniref:YXWGXW repeat-containing protein n=1 Tax=Ramlibacter sp. TaxID=1917967 RepID=UPI0017F7CA01|nr:YXWGXW repeat-containing protein [Ramlibacter sp.]MBA2673826.1 YXWGXW repeat-containing protein [Ramlibacter sp.]
MKRNALFATLLAAGTMLGSATAFAVPAIVVDVAPPAPRSEVMPAPRAGRVWVEGHYQWRDGEYAWRPGHWQAARNGMHWEQARWEQRDGQWMFMDGHWARGGGDRVGMNRRDDRSIPWGQRDSDGDGVRNRNDRFPNNPNRS